MSTAAKKIKAPAATQPEVVEPASNHANEDAQAKDESFGATIIQLFGTARDKIDESVSTFSDLTSDLKSNLEALSAKVPTDKVRRYFSDDYTPVLDAPERGKAASKRMELIAKAFDGVKVSVGSKTIGLGADLLLNYVPFGNRISQGAHIYTLAEAVRWGADRDMLERMVGRIGMDMLASAVPLAGPWLDAMRLSHSKNARELQTLIDGQLATLT